MAKCGIEKYDKLPGRVGIIDVDMIRAKLSFIDNPSWIERKLSFFKIFTLHPSLTREDCIKALEEAHKNWMIRHEKQN